MQIEGIIDGLRTLRGVVEQKLPTEVDIIDAAIEKLESVEADLDTAYKDGKYDQLCECFADVLGIE